MKKFSQRIGEGVRIYKKTEEDEDFVQQEKLVDTTRYRCACLHLAPKMNPHLLCYAPCTGTRRTNW
jgi:hypothetical protein